MAANYWHSQLWVHRHYFLGDEGEVCFSAAALGMYVASGNFAQNPTAPEPKPVSQFVTCIVQL